MPTREKTLQPYQVSPKINGKPVLKKYDGLVFQPMSTYKVSEQKDGATLLFNDGPVTTWEIILGDHTAENLKKTKHKFAVRVPVKPMFDECTEPFGFLAKLLKTRLEEVESKPGALVFGTHLKTHGVGKNGFQKYFKEDLKAPTDIGGFRSSVEQYAEDLFLRAARGARGETHTGARGPMPGERSSFRALDPGTTWDTGRSKCIRV